MLPGYTIVEAKGAKQVSQAVLAPLAGGQCRARASNATSWSCPGGFAPATSLLLAGRGATRYDAARGHFVVAELPPDVYAAGDVAGDADPTWRRAGERAGRRPPGRRSTRHPSRPPGPRAEPSRRRRRDRRGKCFACLCEDVTAKDIKLSIDEGYDSIELSKRYTTVTMGPCQGRMCQLASIRLMAEETGQSLQDDRDDDRAAAMESRCRWACWPAGRSSRPSARRSTAATAS